MRIRLRGIEPPVLLIRAAQVRRWLRLLRTQRILRQPITTTIGAKSNEIYFTSSGSEANSWAIVGIAEANRDKGNHIITSKIEHPSVLEACKFLENNGYEVTYLDVDKNGFINFAELLRSLKPNTVLISIMSANNELGTIQNIKAISQTAHEKGIIFHTDAVQLFGNMNIDAKNSNRKFKQSERIWTWIN